jgi:hypothetical protein
MRTESKKIVLVKSVWYNMSLYFLIVRNLLKKFLIGFLKKSMKSYLKSMKISKKISAKVKS